MRFKTELLGDHIALRKGLSYKGDYLVEESTLGLVGLDAFVAGGGYKPGAEKPYSGPFKPDHLAESGDVLLAMTEQQDGLLASPLIFPENLGGYEELVLSHHVAKVVAKSGQLRPEFVFNFLRIPINRTRAAYGNTGTTVQDLPYDVIYEQLIPIPSLHEQDRINSFIATLDRKIELNTAMAATMERITHSIFRSWFIDFDPVKAKMAGEKPVGMDEVVAALFPNSMEDTELNSIPKGWQVSQIKSLTKTLVGGTPSRARADFWNGHIPWFNSGKVNEFRITEATEYITEIALQKSAAKLLPVGTTVLAITGATLGQYSRLEIEASGTQNVIGILESETLSNEFIYSFIANGISRIVEAGTGGAQQHVNKEIVDNFEFIFPGADLINEFTLIVKPMFAQIASLSFNNKALSQLRDSLLPKLIMGEIRIPDEMLVS